MIQLNQCQGYHHLYICIKIWIARWKGRGTIETANTNSPHFLDVYLQSFMPY